MTARVSRSRAAGKTKDLLCRDVASTLHTVSMTEKPEGGHHTCQHRGGAEG